MSLPPEQEAAYSAIIDDILSKADLQTISAKRIRKELQARVDYDITPQKDPITKLILQRFDRFHESTSTVAAAPPEPAPTAIPKHTPAVNGVYKSVEKSPSTSFQSSPKKRATSDPDDEDDEDSGSGSGSSPAQSPPKKKPRKSTAGDGVAVGAGAGAGKTVTKRAEEDDAAFAKRLQAEENMRARSTRGGGASAKRRAPVKGKAGKSGLKKKKAKSAKKVKSDDDSEVDSEAAAEKAAEKEAKKKGGFHKPMALSVPLQDLLGETQLSRPETVKKIWEYIKQRDLQDPADRRQIRCDESMRAVFKTEKVHMFTMNKILNQNLYALDE